jgi:hypothetical protein
MEQTVAYYKKTSTGSWSPARTQKQDDTYGIPGKSIDKPTLGIIHPQTGSVHLHNEAIAVMNESIWGPDKKPFAELIPDFPERVPEMIGSDYWPWNIFDPTDPSTYPTSQYPPDAPWIVALNSFRGWECYSDSPEGALYQNMHWFDDDPDKALEIWTICGITKYRRQKETGDQCKVPNPEYPIVEQQRMDAFDAYNTLVRSNLVPVGYYQFQGLPLNLSTQEYQWGINGVRMAPDPAHKLAVQQVRATDSTFKRLPAAMRNPEIITVRTSSGNYLQDLYEHTYKLRVGDPSLKLGITPWDLSKAAKMAYLVK